MKTSHLKHFHRLYNRGQLGAEFAELTSSSSSNFNRAFYRTSKLKLTCISSRDYLICGCPYKTGLFSNTILNNSLSRFSSKLYKLPVISISSQAVAPSISSVSISNFSKSKSTSTSVSPSPLENEGKGDVPLPHKTEPLSKRFNPNPNRPNPIAKEESNSTHNISQGSSSYFQGVVQSAQPYLRLSRIHQPIGTWLLFWPCTWGLGLATGEMPGTELLALFAVGAFIMRGAGCTINDMWDRHIDKNVRRTSDRPLASGELRMRHATAWLAFQLSLALTILAQLNQACFIIGVGSLGLVTLYPLAKRVTNWPQAVLGSTFNVGVLMGFTAAAKYNELGYFSYPWIDPACISLYLAGVSWTLIYDTIYAHQDREDDIALGLGSTARRFGENTKPWLYGFSGFMISSLTAGGILSGLCWPYYASVAAVSSHLAWQITTLDINNPQNCSERFKSNRHIGWMLFLGILASGLMTKRNNDISKPAKPSDAMDITKLSTISKSSLNASQSLKNS